MARTSALGFRQQSAHLAWIITEAQPENVRLRTGSAGLSIGALVYVQRKGEAGWRAARRVEQPPTRHGYERLVWLDYNIQPDVEA